LIKKTGTTSLSGTLNAEVIDLPGTYSLYPRRMDEWVSYKVLLNQDKDLKADVVVVGSGCKQSETKSSLLQSNY
jgi:ferrous iron transport protein B